MLSAAYLALESLCRSGTDHRDGEGEVPCIGHTVKHLADIYCARNHLFRMLQRQQIGDLSESLLTIAVSAWAVILVSAAMITESVDDASMLNLRNC